MNFESVGSVLAEISNPHYKKNKIIYLAKDGDKTHVKDSFNKLILNDPNSKFELSIDKDKERSIYFISGPSGSGKSYFAAKIIEKYHKAYPKNPVYVFSSVEKDSAFDKFKYVNRINLEGLLEEKISVEDFESSLLIMDDTDCITNKKIKEAVHNIANEALQKGRHSKTSVIFTSHITTDGRNTRHILNEAHYITIFVKNANERNLVYLLSNYFGMSKQQIEYIKKMEGRATTIIKSYPQVLLTENEISFTSDLLSEPNESR
jgi:nucleoside-triphosphatase THEP1